MPPFNQTRCSRFTEPFIDQESVDEIVNQATNCRMAGGCTDNIHLTAEKTICGDDYRCYRNDPALPGMPAMSRMHAQ